MKKKKKRGDRPSIAEAMGKRLEIDADLMRSGVRVEMRGRQRVEIGGVRRVVSYEDTCVRLQLTGETVAVTGCRLECVFYRDGEMAVEGRIDGVSFGG